MASTSNREEELWLGASSSSSGYKAKGEDALTIPTSPIALTIVSIRL